MSISVTYSNLDELPTTRSEALQLGMTIYYTGNPCKNGHLAVRYTHSGCSVCRNNICATSYRSHPKNKEKAKRESRKWYKKNTDRTKLSSKVWRDNNTTKVLTQCAKRRATKKQAIPKWEDSISLKEHVNQLYDQAKQLELTTGVKHQVDHIIPLNSKIVCGLHCKNNLRVITATENNKKKNKLIEEILEYNK